MNLELDGYCEELKMAFEYDGEQHFLPIRHWGGENRLHKTQERDKLKDVLCKQNNVELLRISYKQVEDIDSIIREFIRKANYE